MKKMFKALVGQSGGPTCAINASLAGVIKAAKDNNIKLYGMRYGIQGFLNESFIDIEDYIYSDMDIEILKRTPSSYLGSCRYKLADYLENESDYIKIFELLKKYEIDFFFYIGGNDSMDTIKKLSAYSKEKKLDIKFIGIPKTIDNDLVITDHTPGFGSAAKYIATSIKELIRDSLVYDIESVTIVEIMGRNAGWLTACAALAKDETCEGADLIYLPENVFDIDSFVEKVDTLKKTKKSLLIAVSEGIKLKDGRYVCETSDVSEDVFGHKNLSGTAVVLAEILKARLNCKVRAIELNTLQRCASHLASQTDINESFLIGKTAIEKAIEENTGIMICINRISDVPYQYNIGIADIEKVANLEKKMPKEFISEDETYITDKFLKYAKPLIQGELLPFIVDGLPAHKILK